MGDFPNDEARAFSVIAWGTVAAAMARATKVIVKPPRVMPSVPAKEAIARGLRCTRQIISMLGDQLADSPALAAEREIISGETRCIVDRIFELGDGDPARGVSAAFKAGVLDVPFAASRFNAGRVVPARDNEGAVRFLETGALPLPPELLEFHRGKIAAREKFEKRPASLRMVIDDVEAVSRGMLVGRPG
jgi:methylaspartate mutase epsilon subunit